MRVAEPLPLFERGATPASHPLAAELATLELDALTPLEALNLLARWKREHGSEP